ncbi:MAG: alpha-1,2-fucosyltransferase [Neisseriaceae bacterium]|nr:MAG: alpha-1,2-fucosyltransferase [Neisseriaceae bacterium]
MQIIWCSGGLGNQMFQYAFYRRLQLDGKSVTLDISGFNDYGLHNGFELDKIFPVKINLADEVLINNIKQKISHLSLLKKIWWKVFTNFRPVIVQKNFGYSSRLSNLQGLKYLEGYWQSEKYFGTHSDTIRNDFKFPLLDIKNKDYADKISQGEAVSIHIRMGDYVNHPLHGGICTLEYYKKALSLIEEKVESPLFFIFSNDIEWCQNNLKLDKAIYVTGNEGKNSFRDMHLMSMCKHNIIANSSFSWWGAWLNNNPDKVVVAPSKWFNDKTINTKDLLPDSWIQI